MKQWLFSNIAITGHYEDASLLYKSLIGQLKVDFLLKGSANAKIYENMFIQILKTILSVSEIFLRKLTEVLFQTSFCFKKKETNVLDSLTVPRIFSIVVRRALNYNGSRWANIANETIELSLKIKWDWVWGSKREQRKKSLSTWLFQYYVSAAFVFPVLCGILKQSNYCVFKFKLRLKFWLVVIYI